jgi:P-type Cu+ transporter
MATLKESTTRLNCFHCGEQCDEEVFYVEEKPFCCFGCKTVYEILNENNLCTYYDLAAAPGKNRKETISDARFQVLERPDIRSRFVTFEDERQFHITFYLPHIHCSSCIWLLENLHTLNDNIIHARVDFRRKEIFIIADKQGITLPQVAALLDSVGYEPYLSLQDEKKKTPEKTQKGRLIRLAVAGFCFGNIMLFSAPEYLAKGTLEDPQLQLLFQYMSLLLAIPVFFYSANEFYISSWKSLRNKYLNIDAPIAAAIIITFVRSLYMVFVEGQGGYFDSMSGIVFFMLLGRYFQDRTYKMVTFHRDYTSYFPLAAAVIKDGKEEQIPVSELKTGDVYIVRNNELVPADSILVMGHAHMDYSFVTGEAVPVDRTIGELLYAGGRQKGSSIQLKVIKEVSQSYLTQLWNKSDSEVEESNDSGFVQVLSKYFAYIVFILSFIAFIFWLVVEPSRALDALITPMIIACPCALLLSATFTNGNAIARLGQIGIYLKNAEVLEKLTRINAIVFDKTGTIAQSKEAKINWSGLSLTEEQKSLIYALANESAHPYSRAIARWCYTGNKLKVHEYSEVPGKGIHGVVAGHTLFIGKSDQNEEAGSVIIIDDERLGICSFEAVLFDGMSGLFERLKQQFPIHLLSGDTDKDRTRLSAFFDQQYQKYYCTPEGKRQYIKALQNNGQEVMMLGDGLNDAGALLQSNVGVAVTADISAFTPASDIVLDARQIGKTDVLLQYAAYSKKIVIWSFVLSIIYNIAGLFFALQGLLQPVIAAILMPLSTITIVLFTTGFTSLYARRLLK